MTIALAHRMPYLSRVLFGDREKYGLVPVGSDPDWLEWQARQYDFYMATQRQSAGLAVNRSGYKIMRHVDLDGKRVLEIGPGNILHSEYWRQKPAHWTSVDYRSNLLDIAAETLDRLGVPHDGVVVDPSERALPFEDGSFDVALSFYALEHFHPLGEHLAEIKRVLRPGGVVAGAIPCEGGLAWGLGRAVTSRRWVSKNAGFDLMKVICWEHPNFADQIIGELDRHFARERLSLWPLRLPVIDANLTASFVYRNG